MKSCYIRWLNAYCDKSRFTLYQQISHEVKRTDEAACEPLMKAHGTFVSGICPRTSRVGVLIKSTSIFRQFRKDCWSRYEGKPLRGNTTGGRLVMGRMNPNSTHGEAWAHMKDAIEAIVVFGGVDEISKKELRDVLTAAKNFSLPVVAFTHKGEIKEVKL